MNMDWLIQSLGEVNREERVWTFDLSLLDYAKVTNLLK